MISNFHKNCVGTISFDARLPGMRKAQEFVVYPVKKSQEGEPALTVQSDTRIGTIDLATGVVVMSKPHAGGAYQHHLAGAQCVATLSGDALRLLTESVIGTASPMAGGSSGLYLDNSGASACGRGSPAPAML